VAPLANRREEQLEDRARAQQDFPRRHRQEAGERPQAPEPGVLAVLAARRALPNDAQVRDVEQREGLEDDADLEHGRQQGNRPQIQSVQAHRQREQAARPRFRRTIQSASRRDEAAQLQEREAVQPAPEGPRAVAKGETAEWWLRRIRQHGHLHFQQ